MCIYIYIYTYIYIYITDVQEPRQSRLFTCFTSHLLHFSALYFCTSKTSKLGLLGGSAANLSRCASCPLVLSLLAFLVQKYNYWHLRRWHAPASWWQRAFSRRCL